jgi:hypothetical protein
VFVLCPPTAVGPTLFVVFVGVAISALNHHAGTKLIREGRR